MIKHSSIWLTICLALAYLAACGQPSQPPAASEPTTPARPTDAAGREPLAPPATDAPSPTVPVPPKSAPATHPTDTTATSTAASAPGPQSPTITPPRVDAAARLKTAVPRPQPATARPGAIPIYPLGQAGAARGAMPDYGDAVVSTAKRHLARRLGVGEESISVIEKGQQEVAVAAPCGASAKPSGEPVAGGLTMGYEVVLESGGQRYHYVAIGGLAYACGAIGKG